MSAIAYRPEIDGLRAVAVIPVILFHMGSSSLPGGFIGVDVFFVISGFLITSILEKEIKAGTFSFWDFWARRIRRILPAMVFVSACTLALAYIFAFRPDQHLIARQAIAALSSLANIYFWRSAGSYWGTQAEASPFLHAWSLSVEEQFYVAFPIFLWCVFRFRPKSLQLSLSIAVIASFLVFMWGIRYQPIATFYLLPTRAWEIGSGCLLAVTLSKTHAEKQKNNALATVGLGMIGLSYLLLEALNAGVGFAVLGATLVIAYGQDGIANTFLSQKLLVHIGKLSYSLYLWHWPILVLAEPIGIDWPGVMGNAATGILIYGCSLTTYHLVERRFRRRSRSVPSILLGGLVVLLIAIWIALNPRTIDTNLNRGQFNLNRYSIHPTRPPIQPDDQRHLCFDIPAREHGSNAYLKGGVVRLRDDPNPRIVLLGDSFALHWATMFDMITEKHGVSMSVYAMESWWPFCTIPLPDDQFDWRSKVVTSMLKHLSEWKPDIVIIGQRWIRDSNELPQCIPLIEWLGQQKIMAVLVEMPPEILGPPNRVAALHAVHQGRIPHSGQHVFVPAIDADFNRIPRELARRYPHVTLLKAEDLYGRDGEALMFMGFDPVYVDGGHLSQYGAMLAFDRFESLIVAAKRFGHEKQDD